MDERTYRFYDEELKNRYIEYKEEVTILPEGFAKRIFDSANEFENNLRKDVSCFTFYEILDMYKTWNETSLSVLSSKNSFLCNYAQWCLQQNLIPDSQNHFEEVNTEILRGCLNIALKDKQIMNRGEVIDLARSLNNPCDGFLVLGLFEGICGIAFSEFYDIKIGDFSIENNDIFISLNSGRKIHISNDLYNMALNAEQETRYYSIGADTSFEFIPSDKIMKDFPNTANFKDNFSQRIASKIRRNMKYKGIPYVTSNTLKESGKIDFIKRKALEKGMSTKQYLLEY